MSPNHPNHGSSQVDSPQEVACRLVVARGNSPILLELGKAVLDNMARHVQHSVISTLALVWRLLVRRDGITSALFAHSQQWLNAPLLRVIALVGNNRYGSAAGAAMHQRPEDQALALPSDESLWACPKHPRWRESCCSSHPGCARWPVRLAFLLQRE